MKAFIAAVALIGMALVSATTNAQTGNEMLSNCREFLKDPPPSSQMFPAGLCAGYVMGIADGFLYAQIADPKRTAICIPETGYTVGQGVRVLKKYLEDHPETLNQNASIIALTAFRAAFPCK